ncbi:MAG: permease, partial [Spirochaetaceae bacterium]|nr:permease [Spirochaetaceae bacterium]
MLTDFVYDAIIKSVRDTHLRVGITSGFLSVFSGFFGFLWSSFLLLAPMLLLGLFLAGVIHVMISRQAILRWLRHDSLKSVSTSAAVGVPIPLCSCSVVPVVAEMRRKGASRSSCMSFLITAPETGADSILITNAFFGFLAAVARPVISFITAVVAGIFCIGLIRDRPAPHDND